MKQARAEDLRDWFHIAVRKIAQALFRNPWLPRLTNLIFSLLQIFIMFRPRSAGSWLSSLHASEFPSFEETLTHESTILTVHPEFDPDE